ncbi:hydroxyacylglutathione hydrolase [Microbulbifer bruguierae]|uniref:Hydroxyacylglutathione hydrolase n=1 Tax=Microbulbifer bruguierae TaxID=3029061 RepID=A0ABY8NEL8_9GAMM|nr:hydroxyacylglutathione hydrolase [Microbulbifer bruguierae]WGL17366.1 hydroxyacylglutathione hydrolase [Microbulbifer bruguierae]
MITIRPIAALRDNYIWHLQQNREHWVVDPGDAGPVFAQLGDEQLSGILLTHHHYDHTDGVKALVEKFDCPVLGPATINGVTRALADGDQFEAIGHQWRVIGVPGHTLDHIALLLEDEEGLHLFCGDTLFAAGCGRLFEGTPEQMYQSLSKLAALPPDTRVYCTHEYTLSNLQFAKAADPNNEDVTARIESARAARAESCPTLPSTIALELATNPFLRTETRSIRQQAAARGANPNGSAVEIFATLRQWKDVF